MNNSFYHSSSAQQYSSMPSHQHQQQHPRSRRGLRAPSSQGQRHQFGKIAKAGPQAVAQDVVHATYARDLEAARGFEFEDDEVFCPVNCLTEDDLHSIQSTHSDRSSMSSNSPENSPLPLPQQPNPSFLYSSAYQQGNQPRMKLHQPIAHRTRNAIPIVDPSRTVTASPPSSMTSGMQQPYARRWL